MSGRFWPTPRSREDCDYQNDRGDRAKPRLSLTGMAKRLEGIPCHPGAPSISSAADSPASRSVAPGSDKGMPTRAGSGPRCVEFARWSDRDGCWSKTSGGCSQLLMDGSSEAFSGTWPTSGTLLNGVASARLRLARLTSGTGCGFLGTPTAAMTRRSQAFAEGRAPTPLERATWPTPSMADAARKGGDVARRTRPGSRGDDLQTAVLWPTPCRQNHRDGRASDRTLAKNSRPLQEAVVNGTGAATRPTTLNPAWVEWLQGVPIGWTALPRSETP